MSSVKSLQSAFLSFIQSYKNIFNTTYGKLQQNQNPQSQESMLEKQMLIEGFYQSYKIVISLIDQLQEVNTEQIQRNEIKQKTSNEENFNAVQIPNGQNMGGLSSVESKYEKYEREICESHDKAVHRYKSAIMTADVWRQKLYTFINENLPSGNH